MNALNDNLPADSGFVIVPRRVGMSALYGGAGAILAGFVFLASQIYVYADDRAQVRADIATLQRNDLEARGRGDEARRRIADFERDRADGGMRLARVEEQLTAVRALMQEIRDDLRRRPEARAR